MNNRLKLNNNKTVIMFNTKIKHHKKIKINFNDTELKHNVTVVLLGLIYNDKLNYRNHLQKGTKKKKSLIIRIK